MSANFGANNVVKAGRTYRALPLLAAAGLLAAAFAPNAALAQGNSKKEKTKPTFGLEKKQDRKDRDPGLQVTSELERNVRRALDERISKDTGKNVKVDLRTSEEYDVSSSETGVRGRGVAEMDGNDRAFRYDVVVQKNSYKERRVRYNWLDGSDTDGSVPQKTRRAIAAALEDKIRKDTGRTVNVELRTWDDYDAGSNRDGVRGRAFADFSSGDDRSLTYDVLVNERSDDVERVRYDFQNDDTDPANQRLRRIAKEALEEEIREDRGKRVTVTIRTADDYNVSTNERGLRGRGVARLDDRDRSFEYDMIINTRTGNARRVNYDWTGDVGGGGGNSKEDMVATAKRAIRNRLKDRQGDETRVFFDEADLRNRTVHATGRYTTGGVLIFKRFNYRVHLDSAGRVTSIEGGNRDRDRD